jgi:hypothetical protein
MHNGTLGVDIHSHSKKTIALVLFLIHHKCAFFEFCHLIVTGTRTIPQQLPERFSNLRYKSANVALELCSANNHEVKEYLDKPFLASPLKQQSSLQNTHFL